MGQPLTEKYRPRTLDEVCGNREVIACLRGLDVEDLPNMLFYGPPGTGKTTAIRALLAGHPRNCVLELNASDERGIETVRSAIKAFASTRAGHTKVAVLDEADSMSRDAQGALRRIMEDYPGTRFCLICNYSRRIIEPIASRCTHFRFAPVNEERRVVEVCEREGIAYDAEGVAAILRYSDGDMRKVMNDIQGISSSYERISKANVLEFFGFSDEAVYREIFGLLRTGSFDACLRRIAESGLDCIGLLENTLRMLMESDVAGKYRIARALADIEHRLRSGCEDAVQMNALVGAFVLHRDGPQA